MLQNYVSDHATWVIFIIWKILNLLFLFHLKIQNANTSGLQALLNTGFGDYMQLPPEEDRQPHHEALIVDTKNRTQNILKINKR